MEIENVKMLMMNMDVQLHHGFCLMFGTGFVLMITLFFHLTKSTSDLIEEIGKNSAADNTFRFDRPFCIAILTEMGEDDEIKKVFNREKNIRGSEKEATVC